MTSSLAALAAACCLLLPALSLAQAQTQTPAIAHGAAEAATPVATGHQAPNEAPHEKLSPSMRPLSPPVRVNHPPRRRQAGSQTAPAPRARAPTAGDGGALACRRRAG